VRGVAWDALHSSSWVVCRGVCELKTKPKAAGKRTHANRSDTERKFDCGECITLLKRTRPDRRDAVWNVNRDKPHAQRKRTLADRNNAAWDADRDE